MQPSQEKARPLHAAVARRGRGVVAPMWTAVDLAFLLLAVVLALVVLSLLHPPVRTVLTNIKSALSQVWAQDGWLRWARPVPLSTPPPPPPATP